MNVRATSRAGARSSRLTSRQQLISLKGGNLFLRKAAVPREVAPGGVVDIDTIVSNGALAISPFDDDECSNGANRCSTQVGAGYCYNLRVNPDWTAADQTGPTCIGTTEIGTADQDRRWTFTAPGAVGDFVVTFQLEAVGTGERGRITQRITVTREAESRPPPNDDNGNGDGLLGDIEQIITLVVVLFVLALLAGVVS